MFSEYNYFAGGFGYGGIGQEANIEAAVAAAVGTVVAVVAMVAVVVDLPTGSRNVNFNTISGVNSGNGYATIT